VAAAAARHGVPVVAVAGRRTLPPERLRAAGITAAYALQDLEPDLSRCIADAGPLLERLGATVARDWLADASAEEPGR
jgi:glycerate 2-kinase